MRHLLVHQQEVPSIAMLGGKVGGQRRRLGRK